MTATLIDVTETDTDTDRAFVEIVDELTRRGLLGGLGAAGALALVGCGSSPDPAPPAARSRTVQTVFGDVEIPLKPTRIVAANFPEACALLDLGVTPIGRPSYMPALPAYDSALAGVPTVDDPSGMPRVEKIAALGPDLIVTADWADPSQRQTPYDELSAIAPTAVFAWEQAAGNWRDQAADTAAAIGKTAELNALTARYADRAAELSDRYAGLFADTRWDLVDCFKTGWDLYGQASSHGGVLTEAGVRLAAAASQSDGYREYSFERLGMLAETDVIVTTTVSMRYFEKQDAFAQLPAVQAGHVYPTDLFFPASYGIALALLDDLDAVCAKLSA
jgi:iron complex transport system substrate-binding protein